MRYKSFSKYFVVEDMAAVGLLRVESFLGIKSFLRVNNLSTLFISLSIEKKV